METRFTGGLGEQNYQKPLLLWNKSKMGGWPEDYGGLQGEPGAGQEGSKAWCKALLSYFFTALILKPSMSFRNGLAPLGMDGLLILLAHNRRTPWQEQSSRSTHGGTMPWRFQVSFLSFGSGGTQVWQTCRRWGEDVFSFSDYFPPQGEVKVIKPGLLGHEWDEDLDNGFRWVKI